LVDEFQRAISAELDYAQEADNAERFADNFADAQNVTFPKVYAQASSRKVITLEYIPGDKVLEAVARGASGERIAKTLIQTCIRMIFEHGFFHADPHPGNILIGGTADAPVLGMIDLGLVGRLTPKLRDRMVDLVVAVGREDYRAIAAALYAIGRPTKKIDKVAFEAEVMRLSDKYRNRSLGAIAFSDLIHDLASGAVRYGIEVPAEFAMVGKTAMTVEGIVRQIYPQMNLVVEVKPHLAEILGARYSPERLTNDLIHIASRIGSTATELPAVAEDILEDLRHGRLTLEVGQRSLLHAQERLGRRLFASILLAGMVIGGSILLSTDHVLAGAGMLGIAAIWGFLHSIALAIGRNRPPK
jgi:ubiquinone biosynthesis protein